MDDHVVIRICHDIGSGAPGSGIAGVIQSFAIFSNVDRMRRPRDSFGAIVAGRVVDDNDLTGRIRLLGKGCQTASQFRGTVPGADDNACRIDGLGSPSSSALIRDSTFESIRPIDA